MSLIHNTAAGYGLIGVLSDASAEGGPSPGTPALSSGVPGYWEIGVLAGRPVACWSLSGYAFAPLRRARLLWNRRPCRTPCRVSFSSRVRLRSASACPVTERSASLLEAPLRSRSLPGYAFAPSGCRVIQSGIPRESYGLLPEVAWHSISDTYRGQIILDSGGKGVRAGRRLLSNRARRYAQRTRTTENR